MLWPKKNSYKEFDNEKNFLRLENSCTPSNPKKYSCYGLKKIHTRNLITKKNSCGSKIPLPPPPPHNFSNGRSFRRKHLLLQSSFSCGVLLNYPLDIYN